MLTKLSFFSGEVWKEVRELYGHYVGLNGTGHFVKEISDLNEEEDDEEDDDRDVDDEVGENEVDVEAGDSEETQSDEAVDETQTMKADVPVMGEEEQTRKRRRLRKATSTELAVAGDSEETQFDEDVPMERLAAESGVNKEGQTRIRRQKQVARTGLAAKRAKTDKGKVSPVELGTKPRKEPVVSGNPTVEELEQQVDELLARPFVSESVHEGEIDRGDKDQEGQKDAEEVVVMDGEDDDEEKEKRKHGSV
ncbi:hypothetical protein Dimus_003233 [Dionaea muscipula]